MIDFLHTLLSNVVDLAIVVFEFIGVFILIFSGIKGAYEYMSKNPLARLNLARGMAAGLEFKLGSEILRTVVIRDFDEIFLVGSIIVLRAALTFLIHWEIKNEEKEKEHLVMQKANLQEIVADLHETKEILQEEAELLETQINELEEKKD